MRLKLPSSAAIFFFFLPADSLFFPRFFPCTSTPDAQPPGPLRLFLNVWLPVFFHISAPLDVYTAAHSLRAFFSSPFFLQFLGEMQRPLPQRPLFSIDVEGVSWSFSRFSLLGKHLEPESNLNE